MTEDVPTDPCIEQVNAVLATLTVLTETLEELDARLLALDQCRESHAPPAALFVTRPERRSGVRSAIHFLKSMADELKPKGKGK